MKYIEVTLGKLGMEYDPGDLWGSVIESLFTIAAELYIRGDGPPDEWEYSPGACGPTHDGYTGSIKDMSSAELERRGNILIHAGEDLISRDMDY